MGPTRWSTDLEQESAILPNAWNKMQLLFEGVLSFSLSSMCGHTLRNSGSDYSGYNFTQYLHLWSELTVTSMYVHNASKCEIDDANIRSTN